MPNQNIASFFKDPSASSVITTKAQQIAAPVVRGEDVTVEEMMMGGGLRVVLFILDRSPSMEDVGDMLLEDFNAELVPAIREARQDDVSTLRIGGTSFSSDIITPIWKKSGVYFHSLENLPPLTKVDYDPSRGYATALHEAIIDGSTRAIKYASEEQARTGIAPDVDIIILSDGANNRPPHNPASVRTVIEGRDKNRVRFAFFYFETDMGLDDPANYGRELGFDPEDIQVFAMKPGETREERRRRFRCMMRVMSRVSASKGTSAAQAAVAVSAASDDEDVI